MSKIVKNASLKSKKPDLDKTSRWSPEAETKTRDYSGYFFKQFSLDFVDALENLLGINFKGGFSRVAW